MKRSISSSDISIRILLLKKVIILQYKKGHWKEYNEIIL